MSYDQSNNPYQSQQPVVSGPPHQQYAQPYGAPPPGYPAQAPQPPRKRKWPWIVGGVLLVMILGCAGLFTLVLGGTAKVANDLDNNQKGNNAVAGVMGTPIKDGKFQFTVTKMTCGVAEVGGEYGQKAQGRYCLVDVAVKNVGTTAELFTDMPQAVYDAEGNQYSADSGAGVYANKDQQTFINEINPGNTVKGKLVFDMPAGKKPVKIVLHESTFTEGVSIPLK